MKKLLTVLFVCLCLVSGTGNAKEYKDIFKVTDIKEDVRSSSAAAAKNTAFKQAQIQAVKIVLRHLVRDEDYARAIAMPEDTMQEMVAEVSVISEKTTPVRYIGTLSVSLRPEKVREYLAEIAVPYVQRRSDRILIMPIAPQEIEESWKNALKKEADKNALLNIVFPRNEISANIEAVNPHAQDTYYAPLVKATTTADLFDVADEYNVGTVVIPTIKYDGEEELAVAVTQYNRIDLTELAQFAVILEEGRPLDDFLARAAEHTVSRIENAFKEMAVVNMTDRTEILAIIPIASMKNWADIQKRLKKVQILTDFKIEAMTSKEIYLKVKYAETIDDLTEKLQEQRLYLRPEDGTDRYIISEYRL